MGIPEASLKALAATLLGQGQTQLPTSSLLARLHVTYRDVTAEAADAAVEVRQAPEWAEQLLATVARQCALRKRDSEQLFRSFDSNARIAPRWREREAQATAEVGPEACVSRRTASSRTASSRRPCCGSAGTRWTHSPTSSGPRSSRCCSTSRRGWTSGRRARSSTSTSSTRSGSSRSLRTRRPKPCPGRSAGEIRSRWGCRSSVR
mmetsp:Transcript_20017/g.59740  ORF Transcript_20017/g.59740 Transcript_20017/m.59740 type:complete len:206 (-) Transcript_20017:409-1026(-)